MHVAMLCAVLLPTLFANNANAQCVAKGNAGKPCEYEVQISITNPQLIFTPNGGNTVANLKFDYNVQMVKNPCNFNGNFYTFQGVFNSTNPKVKNSNIFFDLENNVGNSYSGTTTSSNFVIDFTPPANFTVADLDPTFTITVHGPGINTLIKCNAVSPLPIELIDFKPECGTFGNVINWSTASEQNNALFNIYRSVDALNWDLMKSVQGHGNSNTVQTYQIEDLNFFSGLTYYKLEQVDYSGRSTTFQPAFIQCDEQKEQEKVVSIFPNPISANSVIKANAAISEINMYDISGRRMIIKNNIRANEVQLSNIDNLPSGIFIVEIKFEDNTTVVQKIVK